MEIETITLIKTLMSLRGLTQAEVARMTNISKASLSKYINGESDLRSEALVKIGKALGANFEHLMKSEINTALGQSDEKSLGADIVYLLEQASPITRKSIIGSLVASFQNEKAFETKTRVARIKKYRDSIKTVRRQSC